MYYRIDFLGYNVEGGKVGGDDDDYDDYYGESKDTT